MFNIALGSAFLVSFLASPGGRLLSTVFPPDALRGAPPYQGVLLSVIANYWLPATLIYLVLKILRAERYLRPGVVGHFLFGIPNVFLSLYATLRIFTSMVEGGGASFALASLAAPFLIGSLYVLAAAVLWLIVRSAWIGARLGPAEVRTAGPALTAVGPLVALVMIVPAVAILVGLYAANSEKIRRAADAHRARGDRFQQLCDTATRIDIYRKVNDAKSVLFTLPTNGTYPLLQKLDFVELKRLFARQNEPGYERISKKPGEAMLIEGRLNVDRRDILEPAAQYEISVRSIESKSDTEMRLAVAETTIRDRRTNDVLAVFTAVAERNTVARRDEPFCPEGFQYVNYEIEVPSYVLGLTDEKTAQNVEARIAALKNRIKTK